MDNNKSNESNDEILKNEIKEMYNYVNDNEDVEYIYVVSKTIGPIKCYNKNAIILKLLEKTDKGQEELDYQYKWTDNTIKTASDIIKQANTTNFKNPSVIYKFFTHEFYFGEIRYTRKKTKIVFKENFFVLTDVDLMDNSKYKHITVKYDDFDYIMTQ